MTWPWPAHFERMLEGIPFVRREGPAPTINDLTAHQPRPVFEAVWLHCSPALLTAGYHCPSGPRQACDCPPAVGHDHFVDVSWAREHGLVDPEDT